MRYHLESTLPIHAFNPLGGRHSPFKQGMTLEGGGGGGIVSAITDPISSALGTDGGGGGVLGALADVDKAVGDTVPGGWGTIAAIAVPYLAPEAMMGSLATTLGSEAAAAAALSAGTSAATGAIRGEDPEDILKGAALSGATSYGLNSLFGGADVARDFDYVPEVPRDFDYIPDVPRDFDYVPDAPVRDFDTTDIPSSDVPSRDFDTTETPSRDFDVGTFGEIPPETFVPRDFDYVSSTSPEVLVSTTPNLTEEKLKEDFFKELLNAPPSRDFDYVENLSRDFDYVPEGVQVFDRSTPASVETQKMVEKGYLDRAAELPGAAYNAAKSYIVNNPYTSAAVGLGALSLANRGQQPQPQGSPVAADSRYTGGYGSSGGVASPYLLRNRVTASNVYDYENPFDRYATVNRRYAKGGEVKHFAFGGISNALTRFTQPIEKAIVRPIGEAVPFLKDVAPYAGILAAPFIGSPIAAAGIGGLSSGFGRPGSGFDMKRALMGGIAAYGASTLGAGLEASGTTPMARDFDTVGPLNEAVSKPFFRDVGAMERGVGNLLSPSTYDAAATKFGTQAGIYKTGVPLVIGTSGMMAVDEAQKMKEEADRSAGVGRQEQADMLARISKGKKRAEEAVRENPYMFAMGGQVDDELGGDYSAMGMDQGNMQKGLFGMGYAAGGTPRFLSGGGDGMSDSIPATINGTQEARLADGEFVIPADVVSHLGNGSSKAGAKQLYSMMDRVRKARTGNEKQGRQIKPNKMMPA